MRWPQGFMNQKFQEKTENITWNTIRNEKVVKYILSELMYNDLDQEQI